MKSSIRIANKGIMRVQPTMQTSCCETHSEEDKRKFNTCPICLMAVHKSACKERDKLKRMLESLNETVAALRDVAHYHDADKHDYCRKCGLAFMHPVHKRTTPVVSDELD